MGFIDDLKRSARRQGAPVTIGLMVALAGCALLFFFMHMRGADVLVFSRDWIGRPWSLLTYQFTYPWLSSGWGLLMLVFTLFWLFWIGGSMEREIGSEKFAIAYAAFTILPVLFVWLGLLLVGSNRGIADPELPIAGITVAWGFRNPTACIRMWGILPITGFWLAWLTVGITFFNFGYPAPVLGLFACLHLALAWYFAQNRIPAFTYTRRVHHYRPSKAQQQKEADYFDDVRRREEQRQERERLRKLFEKSMIDEDAS